jgi:hypothetical protein
MAVPSQPAALLASEQEPEPELEPELEPRESHDAIVEKLQHTRSQFMDRRWMCEYETAMQNSSTQWIHGWDALDGTGELESGRHGGGYRNAFSGRNTSRRSFHAHKNDAAWKFQLRISGAEPVTHLRMRALGGKRRRVDVVSLVEAMVEHGWEEVKTWEIKEVQMPDFMRIDQLHECHRRPPAQKPGAVELRTLDLSVPDERENLDEAHGDGWESDPQSFYIYSVAELQAWDQQGRPLDCTRGAPHNAGSGPYKHRHQKHPSDPLGLVADKLGRAIADERRAGNGKRLEPVFAHIYSLAHIGPLKGLNKMTEHAGFGAFHAACEIYGVEWSFGGNREAKTGVFHMPPKYCDMHDYKETHYIGDTTLTPSEVRRWIWLLSTSTYKQEDPTHGRFPDGVPSEYQSAREFFGWRAKQSKRRTKRVACCTGVPGSGEHQEGEDPFIISVAHDPATYWPVTGLMAHSIDASPLQFGRTQAGGKWQVVEDEDEGRGGKLHGWCSGTNLDHNRFTFRTGWFGHEYDLLRNNCCYFVDHIIKILVTSYPPSNKTKGLPKWVFSTCRAGASMADGFHHLKHVFKVHGHTGGQYDEDDCATDDYALEHERLPCGTALAARRGEKPTGVRACNHLADSAYRTTSSEPSASQTIIAGHPGDDADKVLWQET